MTLGQVMKKDIANLFYCIDSFAKRMKEEIKANAIFSPVKSVLNYSWG